MILPLLVACEDDEGSLDAFDGPSDVAIMDANAISDVPIGFVANQRSGKIVMVDLKHWSFLRDNPLGSWIRAMPLATGRDRLLEQIAVSASYEVGGEGAARYDVTLFTADAQRNELLVVPYLDSRVAAVPWCVGETGVLPRAPICMPELSGQLSDGQTPRDGVLPVTGPGGGETGVTVTGFGLRAGRTTTETWFATFDCSRQHFVVRGSRSGVQERFAALEQVYFSDDNEIEFLVTGGDSGATTCLAPDGTEISSPLPEGASFTFSTDNGVRAIPMPGLVMDLRVAEDDELFPGERRLYASVQGDDGRGMLVSVDLSGLNERMASEVDWEIDQEIELCPLGAPGEDEECAEAGRPMAMDLDFDIDHQRLFIAEGGDLGGVYQVDLSGETPSYTVLSGLGPALDVAYAEERSVEGGYQHLFTANLDAGTVSLFDVEAGRLVDINPFTPEIDSMEIGNPIKGIGAGKLAVPIPERTDDQVQKESILVGITTHRGQLWSMKGEDGCLVQATAQGPYVTEAPELTNAGPPTNAGLIAGLTSYATFHPCGGITRGEVWTFIYSEALQGFRVRGSRTNSDGSFQQNIAYENQRYVTDGGEISVFIGSGTLPLSDGDTVTLSVNGNLAPGNVEELPTDIELYTQSYGDRNTAWTPVQFRTWAVVPALGTDKLYKYDLGIPGNSTENLLVALD